MIFEPVGDLLQTADAVLRLSAAGELMVFAPEEHHLAFHAPDGQCRIHLVALINGAAIILKGVDE